MSWLKWISDKNLEAAVLHLLTIASAAKTRAVENFNENVIDPFSAIFEISGFQIDYNNWIASEQNRKAQKTLQNHIGDFHQIILGSVEGWKNLKVGNVVDLVNEKDKIIAEVKNKFNTISFGDLANYYYAFDELVMPKNSNYKDYTAYLVAVIPKERERYKRPFTPSDKKRGARCPANNKILEIDGASFYTLVTKDKDALKNLYEVLPAVIKKVSNGVIELTEVEKLKEFFAAAYE